MSFEGRNDVDHLREILHRLEFLGPDRDIVLSNRNTSPSVTPGVPAVGLSSYNWQSAG